LPSLSFSLKTDVAGTDDGSDEVDVEGDAPSRQDSSSVLCGEDESEPEDYANSDAEMDVVGSAYVPCLSIKA